MLRAKGKVRIYGGGISGLVASIHLVNAGFEPEIFESRGSIGGDPAWHPSVHLQYMDRDRTSEYIGIDLSPCFRRAVKHSLYIYDKKKHVVSPKNAFLCLKGAHEDSIENYLYKIAYKLGVNFSFNRALDRVGLDNLKETGSKAIIACGLEVPAYQLCGIGYKVIQGFRASGVTHDENMAISCLGDYTNGEFAYLASFDNKIFGLLFSRGQMNGDDLKRFEEFISKKENINFQSWTFSSGCVPKSKHLDKNGVVFSGTMSGMIDPFYLNGISGALLSGKIAADYFVDENRARREFSRLMKNYHTKKILQNMSVKIPFRKVSFPLLMLLNNHLKTVGTL